MASRHHRGGGVAWSLSLGEAPAQKRNNRLSLLSDARLARAKRELGEDSDRGAARPTDPTWTPSLPPVPRGSLALNMAWRPLRSEKRR